MINVDKHRSNESTTDEQGSLSLVGAVSMGTGVMIGAGIFALTGQMAEQAGNLFPLAFLSAAVVTAFSAYSYIKMSNAHPCAGGIAMYLKKAYGEGTVTAGFALLIYFSMVINESLVAHTFGTYTLQLFDVDDNSWLVPVLGVGVLMVSRNGHGGALGRSPPSAKRDWSQCRHPCDRDNAGCHCADSAAVRQKQVRSDAAGDFCHRTGGDLRWREVVSELEKQRQIGHRSRTRRAHRVVTQQLQTLFCESRHVQFHSIHADRGENQASVRHATNGR